MQLYLDCHVSEVAHRRRKYALASRFVVFCYDPVHGWLVVGVACVPPLYDIGGFRLGAVALLTKKPPAVALSGLFHTS